MNIKFRRSKQRERMLELLRSTKNHPTASWLYDNLKKEFPYLSFGTVYRNLNILIEQNLIRKIDFGSTFDRFDCNTDEHYHFICEKCNSVTDLEMPVMQELNDRVDAATNFITKRHRIEFYGLCEKCKNIRD
jgi:Fur family peroxide stress response transcriptional regulator